MSDMEGFKDSPGLIVTVQGTAEWFSGSSSINKKLKKKMNMKMGRQNKERAVQF